MRARALTAILIGAALAALLGVAATEPARASAASAAAKGPAVVADDFALPLRGWRRSGRPALRSIRTRDGRVLELSGRGRLVRSLVHGLGAVSLDVMVPPGATLEVRYGRSRLLLRRSRGGALVAGAGSWHRRVRARRWAAGGWRHLELAVGKRPRLRIDGRALDAPIAPRGPLVLRARAGAPRVAALVATRRGDAGGLLLHRLAELHARVRVGKFPFGSGSPGGELHLSDGWTSGFWPGALWRAFDRTHARLFRGWALAATLAHFGHEREQVHDQGFRYLESSAAAFDRLCRGSRAKRPTCRRLRKSALTAADVLLALERGNAAAGTIPTLPASRRCGDCASKAEAETLVDSMMNISLVDWAYAHTRKAKYRQLALRHARGVERLLVRSDGSTAQAIRVRRSTGQPIAVETHQGISPDSTWARGQAWAVYGFAYTGAALRDRDLVAVSERTAGYVADHLPAGRVPPFDYDAPPGAPVDTSAGVITAAGLFRLAAACEKLRGACQQPGRWRPLARRMRTASLQHVRSRPPLGYLADQVFARGGHATWDDTGDFIFGTAYALEAVQSR